MKQLDDRLLRTWAVSAIVILLVVALSNFLPLNVKSLLEENLILLKSSTWGFMVLAITIIPIAAVVLGFYLFMLVECGTAKDLRNQTGWLLFLAFVPLVSAFVYFFRTRSLNRQSPDQTET